MLKVLRVILALVCLVAVTLLFVDFTGYAVSHWGFLAKIQLVPAILSANLLVVALLVLLTLVFGRIYCSVICPLGVFQDVVIRLRTWFGGRKAKSGRFRYRKASTALRWSVFALFAVLLIAGAFSLLSAWTAGLIEPYSAYGRISSQLFSPVWRAGNNVLASWAEAHDSYMFATVAVHIANIGLFAVAVLTLVVIVMLALGNGRLYCNTICPVGTLLGWISRFSLLKIHIDTDKCNRCGRCGRNCKSECIDTKNHVIDHSRCVACMDCIGKCSTGAIYYGVARKPKAVKAADVTGPADEPKSASRRSFIATSALVAGALAMKAAEKTTDGGFAKIKQKKGPERKTDIVPAGARSLAALTSRCTACQLCIQNCPNGVLQPSTDLDNFMQPRLSYESNFCRPDCTACSEICPVGAIHPVTEAEKSSIKIGTAVVDPSLCISAAGGQHCGNCARHCPAGAITMAPVSDKPGAHLQPVVDVNACIGCGACEYYCPVGTVAHIKSDVPAIHVEGIEIHRTI